MVYTWLPAPLITYPDAVSFAYLTVMVVCWLPVSAVALPIDMTEDESSKIKKRNVLYLVKSKLVWYLFQNASIFNFLEY